MKKEKLKIFLLENYKKEFEEMIKKEVIKRISNNSELKILENYYQTNNINTIKICLELDLINNEQLYKKLIENILE